MSWFHNEELLVKVSKCAFSLWYVYCNFSLFLFSLSVSHSSMSSSIHLDISPIDVLLISAFFSYHSWGNHLQSIFTVQFRLLMNISDRPKLNFCPYHFLPRQSTHFIYITWSKKQKLKIRGK